MILLHNLSTQLDVRRKLFMLSDTNMNLVDIRVAEMNERMFDLLIVNFRFQVMSAENGIYNLK